MFPFSLASVDLGFWGQTFAFGDIAKIFLLILLEGVLSIDNALVLGLLAKRVPRPLQKRALSYGLIGAFVFRVIAIALASYLLKWSMAKLLGGGYLVYIAVMHLFFESKDETPEVIAVSSEGDVELRDPQTGLELSKEEQFQEIQERVPLPIGDMPVKTDWSFWKTVAIIELTDIAFAVDSIIGALGMVGSTPANATTHPKLWVVVAGGMLGLMLMRVAAAMFIKVLDKFPRFEFSAYLLVIVIGSKLLFDWALNSRWLAAPQNETYWEMLKRFAFPELREKAVLDFHDAHRPEFWIFWLSMILCLSIGFLPKKTA